MALGAGSGHVRGDLILLMKPERNVAYHPGQVHVEMVRVNLKDTVQFLMSRQNLWGESSRNGWSGSS
jgi:hypothetical protein